MGRPIETVTEAGLERFRREQLCPAAVLDLVEKLVQLLLRLPVGVGKTHAALELLLHSHLYQRFDLVVYAAPAWNILHAAIARLEAAGFKGWAVLKPRPADRCGVLDVEWRELESRGCSALAKRILCEDRCPEYRSCHWPGQMSEERLRNVRLVLLTDQRIDLVRSIMPFIQEVSGARRALAILDEARLLDANYEVSLHRETVETFMEAVSRTRCRRPGWRGVRAQWLEQGGRLLRAGPEQLRRERYEFFPDFHEFAYFVQRAGVTHFDQFRYVGYDLSLLATSRGEERWLDDDGFRFIARPYLDRHLLLLSAHLSGAYAGHRLGRGALPSPFEHTRFLHTGTSVINIRGSLGADRHFKKNHPQILDTFAVLITRNIAEGRSTLLVSRKKSKALCAQYLRERLRGWGPDVRFLVEDFDTLPAEPDPMVIPIIHYGILGINDFTEYQSAYCLNSYYINPRELNRAVQEFEPRHFRTQLEIVRGVDRVRRVKLADPKIPDEDRTWLGAIYLRKLEVDPVIQAVGRVRFLTKPREVVCFQQNDLESEIGAMEQVGSLAGLHEAMGLPRAREIDHALEGLRARDLMAQGLTAEEAGAEMGVSRATLFRRLGAAESLRFPLIDSLRKIETPEVPS